ncbi:hypothetical protein [Helicobacter typhlonius]|uniref:hypothetical protein n=1 Tax=Helicobacter typhlonius TaxID=76936 RepID=UPI002FE1E1A4
MLGSIFCGILLGLCLFNLRRILQTEQQDSYLYVLKVVSHSLTLGLSLLGIKAQTRM